MSVGPQFYKEWWFILVLLVEYLTQGLEECVGNT